MTKKISVIVPVFNRAHLIGETLDSVLNQSYNNWECIVVDDGSSDNTDIILREYLLRDSRFKYIKRPNERKKGASTCRNIGIENSNGKYIQFLDSDDILGKEKLSEQIQKLKNSDDFSIVTAKWGRFKSDANYYEYFKNEYNLYKDFNSGLELIESFGKYNEFFPLHVYLIPKILIKKAGFWNDKITNNDDGEFFTRILLITTSVFFANGAEVFYRDVGSSKLSNLDNREKFKSAIKSWKLIENKLYITTRRKNFRYVENAKDYIFNKLKKEYYILLLMNFLFFKNQLKHQFSKFIRSN